MNEAMWREVSGETAMVEAGREIAPLLGFTDLVFVDGDLGAGKTTLIRGILRGLGHLGAVPSPTYTLLETYHVHGRDVVHADLYRLKEPEELEMLGMRDYFGGCLCLIEWPQRASAYLPRPSYVIEISGSGSNSRKLRMRETG
jgi:tRNA threonylcarbamoyladenosine biosynthesis protein TsaE